MVFENIRFSESHLKKVANASLREKTTPNTPPSYHHFSDSQAGPSHTVLQSKRVKFYATALPLATPTELILDQELNSCTSLILVCEPTNLQDPLNCVAAWVPGPWSSSHRASLMLGHVAKEAARWLNPLLDSCFCVTR